MHPHRLLLVALLAGSAFAQSEAPEFLHVPLELDSGVAMNQGAVPEVIVSFPVQLAGSSWLRLYFEEVQLSGDLLRGNGSVLRLTAWQDGEIQELDARQLGQWQNSSAYFNGDTVQVEVLAYPGTGDNRVVLRAADAGQPDQAEDQCGPTDDRVPSSDPRVGRLLPGGCTGYLLNDCTGCALTAGHCAGVISVMQFNVPLSNSNGSLNNPPVADQYVIDPTSIRGSGSSSGVGNDWGYFGTFPNSVTGLTAAQAQGSGFVLAPPPLPGPGQSIRITGFGSDTATANFTLQTHVGPRTGGGGPIVSYVTDTMGGNSGSPVIDEQSGVAVGIHTHGGCAFFGDNLGSSSQISGLQTALANPGGVCFGAGLDLVGGAPILAAPGGTTPLLIEAAGDPLPGTQQLHFRSSPDELFVTQPAFPLGSYLFQASLPAFQCGDQPEFYLSSVDGECGLVTLPVGAPAVPYRLTVGSEEVIWIDDFETDTGWTTVSLGATGGQWERGLPVNDPNYPYDPAADADGSGRCYLTANQLGNSDVDNGSVQLVSPALDLSSGVDGVFYSYFLGLPEGDGQDRLWVVARQGMDPFWRTMRLHTADNGLDWTQVFLAPEDFLAAGVELTATVQVRFTVTDSGFPNTVEAGIDGVQVGRVVCELPPIGTAYCEPAVANSTGVAGVAGARGSTAVFQNSLELVATELPANQFGFFLTSLTQGMNPGAGGSQGSLCLAGEIGRFNAPALNSGALGEMVQVVDLTALPQPLGVVSVVAGETWHFQAWYRDLNPGPASNFTSGVSASFQ